MNGNQTANIQNAIEKLVETMLEGVVKHVEDEVTFCSDDIDLTELVKSTTGTLSAVLQASISNKERINALADKFTAKIEKAIEAIDSQELSATITKLVSQAIAQSVLANGCIKEETKSSSVWNLFKQK